MFDLERLTKIISDIYRYLDDLERMEIKDPRDFDISRRIPAVRKFVEQIKESIFGSDI